MRTCKKQRLRNIEKCSMFNGARLFTFCQWTQSCDVNFVKNYRIKNFLNLLIITFFMTFVTIDSQICLQ